jgi:acetyl esterase/lipase
MSKRVAVLVFAVAAAIGPMVVAGPAPTRENVVYSLSHERCKLDVWLPPGMTSSCPLVVYFHGGGFTQGDKTAFRNHRMLSEYIGKGIAFASANYPLLEKGGAGDLITQAARYLEIMAKAAESIRFLKTKAEEWKVDPARIAVMGTSAGAMIAEHLAYWEDLGITGCYAEEQPYRSAYLLLAVKKGHPPLILYTRSGTSDDVHHPDHARLFKAHFDSVGVKCELYGSTASGLPSLPRSVTIEEQVMRLFLEQWQSR